MLHPCYLFGSEPSLPNIERSLSERSDPRVGLYVGVAFKEFPYLLRQQPVAVNLGDFRTAHIIQFEDERPLVGQGEIPVLYFHQRENGSAVVTGFHNLVPARQPKPFNRLAGDRVFQQHLRGSFDE